MYKVTVAVCCYKQRDWLHRCLRSLIGQTLPTDEFEVIIVNDNPDESLDDICSIVEPHLNIRLINNKENIGLPASLNKTLNQSLGRYFVRIDADDYVSKHFLQSLSLFLDMNRKYQAVACDYKKVDEVGNTLGAYNFSDEPVACGIMFTYESLCGINFYDEKFKMREGHDLLKRFSKKYSYFHLEMPLYRYRQHASNRTKNVDEIGQYDKILNK